MRSGWSREWEMGSDVVANQDKLRGQRTQEGKLDLEVTVCLLSFATH